MISVLMSVYSESIAYVQKAMNSILGQTYVDFEFLVVLDKPDYDEMRHLLNNYQKADHRVKVLINEKNVGLARSMNLAINAAQGEYIARMDADDISKPTRLEEELDFLIENQLDLVSCLADKIDENGVKWGEIKAFSDNLEVVKKLLPVQNIIIHPTILIKTEILRIAGGYRNFASCQDYDLWLRLLTAGYRIGILNRNLFQFRRHKDSITATLRFNQVINERYIHQLYTERIHNNNRDSFSEKNLDDFLKNNGYYDLKVSTRENDKLQIYNAGIQAIKRHRYLTGMGKIVKSLSSKAVRENIYTSLAARKLKKRYVSRGI